MGRSQQSTRPARPLRAAWAPLYASLTAGSARKCRGADGLCLASPGWSGTMSGLLHGLPRGCPSSEG